MAKVSQEYVLKVTAQGLKEVVNEIKGLRSDLAGIDKSATGAAGGFDRVSKSAGTADRNMKGAANATNNSTKAFSKMAQGMTGILVPAYATVAANIFALTAAFGALRRAAAFETQIEAANRLATVTGSSLISIAKDMQLVTKGAISMKDSLTSASLAASAGFDGSTIQKLTKVAENASKALGVSMTDAINRVFKGAIKAEPELLDELGIILRLDPAARKYAATLGKTVDQLTTFEKQQAVVNEVIAQGTEKFSELDDIDIDPYTKLAAAFNDVSFSLISLVNTPIAAFASFFADNIGALTAAVVLFATKVLKTAIPALRDFGAQMKILADEELAGIQNTIGNLKLESDLLGAIEGEFGGVQDVFKEATRSIAQEFDEYEDLLAKRSPAFKKYYDDIFISGDVLDTKGLTKLVDKVDKELAKTEKRFGKNSEIYKQQSEAFSSVRASAIAYLEVLKQVEAGEKNVGTSAERDARQKEIKALEFKQQAKTAGSSLNLGFTAGLEGGIARVRDRLKEVDDIFEEVSLGGKAVNTVMGGFAKTMTFVGGAVGAALRGITRAIPILGQLYIAVEVLTSAWNWLLDAFRDSEKAEVLADSFERLETTIKETGKIAAKYNIEFSSGIFGFKDQLQAATAQRNALNSLNSALEDNIALVESYADTRLEGLFGGSTKELADNLENAFAAAEKFGDIEGLKEFKESLKNAGNNKSEILAIANAFIEVSKKAVKANDSIVNFGERLENASKEADKALTGIVNSFLKISEEQKGLNNLSIIISSFSGDNAKDIGILAKSFDDLGASTLKFMGIASKDAAEITKFTKELSDSQGTIAQLNQDIDNVRKKANEAKGIASISAQANATKEIAALNEKITEEQKKQERLQEGFKVDIESVKKKYIETRDVLKISVEAQAQFNRELAITKFLMTQNKNNVAAQISLLGQLTQQQQGLANSQDTLFNKIYSNAKTAYEDASNAFNDLPLFPKEDELQQAQQALEDAELQYSSLQVAAKERETARFNSLIQSLNAVAKLKSDILYEQALGVKIDPTAIQDLEKQLTSLIESIEKIAGEGIASIIKDSIASTNVDRLNKLRGNVPTLEQQQLATIAAEQDEKLYQKQLAVFNETGLLLDDNIRKEEILRDLKYEQLEAILRANIEEAKSSGTDTERLERTLENLPKSKQEEVSQAARDKERLVMSELAALNKQNIALNNQAAIIGKIGLERRKILIDQFKTDKARELKLDVNSDEIKKLGDAFAKNFDLDIANKFNEEIASMVEGLTPFSTAWQELQANIANPNIDNVTASFKALYDIGEASGNEMTKGFAEVGLAIQEFQKEGKKAGDTWGLMEGVVGGLKTAFAGNEQAMAALQVATDVLALKAAVTAVLTAGQAPFPANFAAMASVAAAAASLLGSIGVAFGGGNIGGETEGITREDYLKENPNIGDTLQTNSLIESVDELIAINTDLFSSGRDLQLALINLGKAFDKVGAAIFTQAGSFSAGNILDMFGVSFGTEIDTGTLGFSRDTTVNELISAGIEFGAAIEVTAEGLVGRIYGARAYLKQQITETESSWWGLKQDTDTSINTLYNPLNENIIQSLQDALDQTLNSITKLFIQFGGTAALELFNGIENTINDYMSGSGSGSGPRFLDSEIGGFFGHVFSDLFSQINDNFNSGVEKLDLVGKSAEEQGEIIAGFFSNLSNKIIGETIPWIKNFDRAGEELTDTLIRVVENILQLDASFSILDLTLDNLVLGVTETEYEGIFGPIQEQMQQAYNEEVSRLNEEIYRAEASKDAIAPNRTSRGGNTTTYLNAIWEFYEDQFDNIQELNTWLGQQINDPLGGNIDRESSALANYFDNIISTASAELNALEVEGIETFTEFKMRSLAAWQDALLLNFKDIEDFNSVFEKFTDALFTPKELLETQIDNTSSTLSTGIEKLKDQLNAAGFGNIAAQITQGLSAEELGAYFNELESIGAFAITLDPITGDLVTTGADLFATFTQVGAAMDNVNIALKEYEDTITSFISDILDRIEAFGISGSALAILNLDIEFEELRKKAKELGIDLVDIETLYGLERLEIIKQQFEEYIQEIKSIGDSLEDNRLTIYQTIDGWNNSLYLATKVTKISEKLFTALGNSIDGLDTSPFNDLLEGLESSDAHDILMGFLDLTVDAPTSLNEQIALVEELRQAVMERYSEEQDALQNLKQLSKDVREFLDDLMLSDVSPLTNAEQLATAADMFNFNLENIFSGDAEIAEQARNNLLDSAKTYLDLASEFFGIGPQFQDIFNFVTSSLEGLDLDIGNQISADAIAINEYQIEILNQLTVLDDLLTVLEFQAEASMENDIGLLSDTLIPYLDGIINKLESISNSTWEPMLAVLQGITSNATGTEYVEYDQLSQIHKGELILNAPTAQSIRSGEAILGNLPATTNTTPSNDEIVNAINILTQVVATSQEDILEQAIKIEKASIKDTVHLKTINTRI